MARASQDRLLRCFIRVYEVMLRAYPSAFRQDFGREMALAFGDLARDVVQNQGGWALIPFILHVTSDWFVTVIQERNDMDSVNRHRSQPSVPVIVGEWVMVLPAALLVGSMAARSAGGHG